MQLEFLGAAHEVTGSCHFLHVNDTNILIDCGMEQGPDLYNNQTIPVEPDSVDYILVTHAHIDHSGLIPLIAKKGFHGKVYASTATTQLCMIMLKDSAHIQETESAWKTRKARRAGKPPIEPMYDVQDAENAMQLFVPCPYDQKITINDGVTIRFRDAGHLLGSSFIEIWAKEDGKEVKLVFSGDLGNGNRPLIRDPEIPDAADYLVIESTYGDRLHDAPPDYAVELAKVLDDTFARGGNLVIPAFSVGRTQEMLYYLRIIKERNLLPAYRDFIVYVDSPLAIEATHIYNENVLECFREEDKELIRNGHNPIMFHGLKTAVTSQESIAINSVQKPHVIISASGMCEAGRIRHHLKHNLWKAESTILFVGYQVPGTLGYNLLHGAEDVKIFGDKIHVAAKIVNLPGISAHADRDHLTAWVDGIGQKPKRIFVVHGEDQVTDLFAQHLTDTLGIPAVAPYSGDKYDLLTDTCVQLGDRKRAEKKKRSKLASITLQKLTAAAERLLSLARNSGGLPHKDQEQFAEEIDDLCGRWDRGQEQEW